MSRTMNKLIEWMNSPEGQLQLEHERKKMEFNASLTDRWVEKIHNLSINERIAFIDKCITKYNSDAYRDREMFKLHCEPRCTLYWYLLEYAEKYCADTLFHEDDNPFYHKCYIIDDKYVIRQMVGQGTVVDMWEYVGKE